MVCSLFAPVKVRASIRTSLLIPWCNGVADDVIARTATEDEEAAAEIHAARLTCPALTMVRSIAIPTDCDVIHCTRVWHCFLL